MSTCTCGRQNPGLEHAPAQLDAATGRRGRALLHRDIEKEHRRKARATLAELRAKLRAQRLQQENAIAERKQHCRAERLAVRERAKARRLAALEELRAAFAAERLAARQACTLAKEEAHRATNDPVKRARAELAAERQYQKELRDIERANRSRHREAKRTTTEERRAESDDEVRANLAPEYLALFEKVRRVIKGSPRKTRTEAFLQYVEEHPREVLAAIEDETEKQIRDLERREREGARYVRRKRYTAAELTAVPF